MDATSALRGRFAPSPTGALHLGNARTALLAWLSARGQGGAFVMRVEDLDGPRTVPSAVLGNLAELRWLGLDWDEGPDVGGPYAPYLQSQRDHHYQAALDRLAEAGLLADDWLSRKELRELASAPHGPSGPVYGPAERAASAAAANTDGASGAARHPSLRLRAIDAPGGDLPLTFYDRRFGAQTVDPRSEVGDVLLRRSDGLWAYAIAVVVDDHLMGVNEVVRGDDLLAATGAQAAIYRCLGWPLPDYVHVPLLLDAEGQRLAKRRGSGTLAAYRDAGVAPGRLVGALAYSAGLLPELRPASPAELLGLLSAKRLALEGLAPASRWTAELEAWVRAGR